MDIKSIKASIPNIGNYLSNIQLKFSLNEFSAELNNDYKPEGLRGKEYYKSVNQYSLQLQGPSSIIIPLNKNKIISKIEWYFDASQYQSLPGYSNVKEKEEKIKSLIDKNGRGIYLNRFGPTTQLPQDIVYHVLYSNNYLESGEDGEDIMVWNYLDSINLNENSALLDNGVIVCQTKLSEQYISGDNSYLMLVPVISNPYGSYLTGSFYFKDDSNKIIPPGSLLVSNKKPLIKALPYTLSEDPIFTFIANNSFTVDNTSLPGNEQIWETYKNIVSEVHQHLLPNSNFNFESPFVNVQTENNNHSIYNISETASNSMNNVLSDINFILYFMSLDKNNTSLLLLMNNLDEYFISQNENTPFPSVINSSTYSQYTDTFQKYNSTYPDIFINLSDRCKTGNSSYSRENSYSNMGIAYGLSTGKINQANMASISVLGLTINKPISGYFTWQPYAAFALVKSISLIHGENATLQTLTGSSMLIDYMVNKHEYSDNIAINCGNSVELENIYADNVSIDGTISKSNTVDYVERREGLTTAKSNGGQPKMDISCPVRFFFTKKISNIIPSAMATYGYRIDTELNNAENIETDAEYPLIRTHIIKSRFDGLIPHSNFHIKWDLSNGSSINKCFTQDPQFILQYITVPDSIYKNISSKSNYISYYAEKQIKLLSGNNEYVILKNHAFKALHWVWFDSQRRRSGEIPWNSFHTNIINIPDTHPNNTNINVSKGNFINRKGIAYNSSMKLNWNNSNDSFSNINIESDYLHSSIMNEFYNNSSTLLDGIYSYYFPAKKNTNNLDGLFVMLQDMKLSLQHKIKSDQIEGLLIGTYLTAHATENMMDS
jgi:hypothetical protein